MTVFPNPSSGLFTMNLIEFDEIVNMQLISLDGKEVYSEIIDCNSLKYAKQYDFKNLKSGIYLLHIQSDNNELTQKLIIK